MIKSDCFTGYATNKEEDNEEEYYVLEELNTIFDIKTFSSTLYS
jgi:hypothetical protein